MFAGVVAACWGQDHGNLFEQVLRTRTRVDMDWLVRFVLTLEAQPTIRNQLRWIASTAAVSPRPVGAVRTGASSRRPFANVHFRGRKTWSTVRMELAKVRFPSCNSLTAWLRFPLGTLVKIDHALQQLWENGFLLTELIPPLDDRGSHQIGAISAGCHRGWQGMCVQLDALIGSIAACDAEPMERMPDSATPGGRARSLAGTDANRNATSG